MTIADLLKLIQDAGVVGVLVSIIVGGLRGWWVPGWMYEQQKRELEQWKQLALSGTTMAERLTRSIPSPRARRDPKP